MKANSDFGYRFIICCPVSDSEKNYHSVADNDEKKEYKKRGVSTDCTRRGAGATGIAPFQQLKVIIGFMVSLVSTLVWWIVRLLNRLLTSLKLMIISVVVLAAVGTERLRAICGSCYSSTQGVYVVTDRSYRAEYTRTPTGIISMLL